MATKTNTSVKDNGRRLPTDVEMQPLTPASLPTSYNENAGNTPFSFQGLEHWVGKANVSKEVLYLKAGDELDIMIDEMYIADKIPVAVIGDGCSSSTYARIQNRTAPRGRFGQNDSEGVVFFRGVTECGSTVSIIAPHILRLPLFIELQCPSSIYGLRDVQEGILTQVARDGRCSPESLTFEIGTRNKLRYFKSTATIMTIWFSNESAWRAARYSVKRNLKEGARQFVISTKDKMRKRHKKWGRDEPTVSQQYRININAHELDVPADVYVYQQWGLRHHTWARVQKGQYQYVPKTDPRYTHCIHELILSRSRSSEKPMVPIEKLGVTAPRLAGVYDLETVGSASDDIFTDATRRGDVILLLNVSFAWKGAVPPGSDYQVGRVFLRWCGSLLPMTPPAGICVDVFQGEDEAALINRFRDLMVAHMDVWCTFGWNNIMFDNPFLVRRNMMLDDAADRFPYRHWMRHLEMEPREKPMKTGSDQEKAVILFDGRMCFDGLFWDRDHSPKRVFGSSLNAVATAELGATKQPVKHFHINAVWKGRAALYADTTPITGDGTIVDEPEIWGSGWTDEDEDEDKNSESDDDYDDDDNIFMEAVETSSEKYPACLTTLDDVAKVAIYCAVDCDLCLRIDDRLGYIEQIMQQATVTCTSSSIVALSGEQTKLLRCLVRYAHDDERYFLVDGIGEAGSGGDDNMYASFGYEGGTVVNPAPAMYRAEHPKTNEVVGIEDFAALYPSLMRQNNFGPSTSIKTADLQKYRAAGYPVKGFKGKTLRDKEGYYYHIQYIPESVDLGSGGDSRALRIIELGQTAADAAITNGQSEEESEQARKIATAIINECGSPMFYRRCEKNEGGSWIQYNDLAPGVTRRPTQGLLAFIEATLLLCRKEAKKWMKYWGRKGDMAKWAMYNGRQLALKVVMNAFYGFLGVGFNKEGQLTGRFPCVRVADVITVAGGLSLRKCVSYVEDTYGNGEWTVNDTGITHKYTAFIVYGDTDSIMVHVKGLPLVEAMRFLKKLETELTALFGAAMEMEFENAMVNLLCLASKMYAGIKLIEPTIQVAEAYVRGDTEIEIYGKMKPVTDMYIKGLKPVRRDNAPICRTILKDVLTALFDRETGGPGTALLALQSGLDPLVSGEIPMSEYITTKRVKNESEYSKVSYPPQHLIPMWMMEKRIRGSAPGAGSRIPLVIVRNHFANAEVLIPPPWRRGAGGWKRTVAWKRHDVSRNLEPPTSTVTRHPDDVHLANVDRNWYLWHQLCGPLKKMLWCCLPEVEKVLRAAERDIRTHDSVFPVDGKMVRQPLGDAFGTKLTQETWVRSERVTIDNARSMKSRRKRFQNDIMGNPIDPRWQAPKSSAAAKKKKQKKQKVLREAFVKRWNKREAEVLRLRSAVVETGGRKASRGRKVEEPLIKKARKQPTLADFFS